MRVTIRHTTSFGYPEPARASFNELRLTPRNDEGQNLISFGLTLEPVARTTQFRDHWGTLVQAFNINAPHDHLTIVGESRVVTYPRPALPDSQGASGGAFDALDDPALRDTLAEWLHPSPLAGGGEPLSTFAQHVRQVVAPSSPFPDTPTPSASGWRSVSHQTSRRDPLATLQSEQQQQ